MTEPAATRSEPALDTTTRADQSSELATTTLLRAAIGPVNTDYYLTLFTRFDAQDRAGPSWNTAAALATVSWMLFRKMWNAALAYVGMALTVALLVFGIGKLVFHYNAETQWALAALYALLLVAVPGFFGNALLFRQCRSDMAAALAANHTLAEASAMLLARAPKRKTLLWVGGLNALALAAVGALALWISDFSGMPSGLGSSTAPLSAPVASGNIAVGRTLEAASAPAAPAVSAPASSPASAPQVTASAPAAMASLPQDKASAATAIAMAASAPQATASAPNARQALPAASAPLAQPTAAKASSAPQQQPSADAVPPRAPTTPASAPAPATAKPVPAPKQPPKTPVEATPHPQPAATTTGSKPVAVPGSTPRSEAAPKRPAPARQAAEPSSTTAPSFGINVGVFADKNNARNAYVKLTDAGFPAYTQELKGKKGKLTRVRVGPFDSAAQAELSMERIQALGLDAQVYRADSGR